MSNGSGLKHHKSSQGVTPRNDGDYIFARQLAVEKKDHGAIAEDATLTIDISDGGYHRAAISDVSPALALTVAFTNWPKISASRVTVRFENLAGAGSITWPSSIKWAGGTEPTWTTGIDFAVFLSDAAGTEIFGFASGLDMQ